jgi:hypothetical protein
VPTIEAGSKSHEDKFCNEEEGDHHTKGQEGDHIIYDIKFNCIPSSGQSTRHTYGLPILAT